MRTREAGHGTRRGWQLTLRAVARDEVGQRSKIEDPYIQPKGAVGGVRHTEPSPASDRMDGLRHVGPEGERPLDIEGFCHPGQKE